MAVRKQLALTGNDAVAYAMKQINPDVVSAYPITPQTSLMEKFSEYVADGVVDTEMILVESEHSAMSAAIGSQAAGARTMTATSSQGLALMWEMCYIASGTRMPIVMTLVNRALSGPLNIHCDHSDSMGARDSGWIQLFSENAQEAYDNLLQANRIAEHPDVLLPVMVNFDGFIISHGVENVTVYEDSKIQSFVGEYKPKNYLLDIKNPITFGPILLTDYYFESKRQQAEAMKNAYKVISEVAGDFAKVFGAKYGFTHGYKLDDAQLVIVGLGSTMGTARVVVDGLRAKGIKAGLLKVRTFRPFPEDEIVKKLTNAKAVAVLDRADSYDGRGGPLYNDLKASLYGKLKLPLTNYIYGLGGRDMGFKEIEEVFTQLKAISQTGQASQTVYLGVRE